MKERRKEGKKSISSKKESPLDSPYTPNIRFVVRGPVHHDSIHETSHATNTKYARWDTKTSRPLLPLPSLITSEYFRV